MALHAAMRQAVENLRRWKRDPASMVRELFRAEPDHWQLDLLGAWASRQPEHVRIAMKAAKGPGKTAGLAWVGWNFLLCYGDEDDHPKGACTSITKKNLEDNLWTEFAKWQNRSPLLQETFTWTKERIFAKDHPETWWLSKRTWAKDADAQAQSDTLAGLHGKYIAFFCDESGGYPRAIMATAEAALANAEIDQGFAKIVQAGNPTSLDGPLYDACARHRGKWYLITITGDPDNPKRAKRIGLEWAKSQIEMYGRENPWVLVNVFGEFPPASLNALLGPDEVEAAMHRHLRKEDYSWAQRRLGIDVARFGDDRTVLWGRQGLHAATRPVVLRQERTTAIAARALLAHRRWKPELIFVDDTGHWGHGVIDNLMAARVPGVLGIQFHGGAIDKRYKNRRAEMWLTMAEWVRRGGALPYMPEIVPEFTEPTYTFVNGVFQLEEKGQIKDRLGYSPDFADALALTFALPDKPGQMTDLPTGLVKELQPGRHLHEFDPLEGYDV